MVSEAGVTDQARALIGRPLSRFQLPTPTLLVDADALERNIDRMARRAKVARRQIAAGALSVCCAKVGEAESLAHAGVHNLLITSPIAGTDVAARVAALLRIDPTLMVVVNHWQKRNRSWRTR